MVVATFRDRKARACREFEVSDANKRTSLAGAACRNPDSGTWIVEGVARIASPPVSQGSDFVPSGSEDKDALDELIARLGAGKALTPDEEQRLMAQRWR
jgi:hypothetical protein